VRKLRVKDTEIVGLAILAGSAGLFIDDWIAGAAMVVLWLGFKLLVTGDRIPVLFLAFMFQWMQVTIGMFYLGIFGRQVPTIYLSDYRPMVLIGLGCVLSLAVGLRAGVTVVRRRIADLNPAERFAGVVTWSVLITAYVIAVVGEGTIWQWSDQYPSLRQIFMTLMVARLGLLFLIMRRLSYPVFRWVPFSLLLVLEVALGFTGFFAGFREPLVLAVLALLEIFDRRRTSHMVSLAGILVVMVVASVMWMGVRDSMRKDFNEIDTFSTSQSARMDRISSLGSGFFKQDSEDMLDTLDNLVDRMWVVYYPALAVARVPSVVPHTNGSIITAAVLHIVTPRALFPGKADLPSDSDMVRKYSGLWVAGSEQGTSIAFGYAAESYVDFGVPVMFLPSLVFGFFMGLIYAWFVRIIWHRELAVAVVTVIFWLSLYLFERSWANTLGYAMSMIIYLGVPAVVIDGLLSRQRMARASSASYQIQSDAQTPMHGGDRVA
jgi:hypothetical protein